MPEETYTPIEMINLARCIDSQGSPDTRVSSTIELVVTVAREQRDRTLIWLRERLEAGDHLEDLLDL
jgi:hypothetical protein